MDEGGMSVFAVNPDSENREETHAGIGTGQETSSPIGGRVVGGIATAQDLPENRRKGVRKHPSATSRISFSTPIRCRGSINAAVSPEGGCAPASRLGLSDSTAVSTSFTRSGTLAITGAARRETDKSYADQFKRASLLRTGTSNFPTNKQVSVQAPYTRIHPSAGATRREVAGITEANRGPRCCHRRSFPIPHREASSDLLHSQESSTADPNQVDGVGQQRTSRKKGNLKAVGHAYPAEPTENTFSLKNTPVGDQQTASAVRRLTKRTGSLPVSLSVQKSFSTAALLSYKRKAAGCAPQGLVEHMSNPTTYSRLPPEVWVYASLECRPVSAADAESDTLTQHWSTVAGDSRSRTSAELRTRTRRWRSPSLIEKQLAFPLEKPDGHPQADFLCRCIPTLLELNNVPTLSSLRHSVTAAEPTARAYSRQMSTPVKSQDTTTTRTFCPPAKRSIGWKPNLLSGDKDENSQEAMVFEAPPVVGGATNVRADASSRPPSIINEVPPTDGLTKGLQAAHDAHVSSEWWAGLMNVADVTLAELHRQLKTFAPFHANCLEVIQRLLVDYADMHQQMRARQIAQLHTSLLEAHAEHAALRKEVANLGHKLSTLVSKAHEAEELRRILDIRAHLFSLQEMEVLTAQQMEEEARGADFQWHQLSEVLEGVRLAEERSFSSEVWTSSDKGVRLDDGNAQPLYRPLSTVLPTVVTLIPHETIVNGTLESSLHTRLLRVYIPPGRWNLGIAVTCSEPLDITLLLLGSNHTEVTERDEDKRRLEQKGSHPDMENIPANIGPALKAPYLHQRARMHSSSIDRPSSVASSHEPRTSCTTQPERAFQLHPKGSNAPDLYSETLQIAAFSSFRIRPEQPQILQVATPAAGLPGGGWVLLRLASGLSTKRNVALKVIEACRNSLMEPGVSGTARGTPGNLQGPPQSVNTSPLTMSAEGHNEDRKLQWDGPECNLTHTQQGGDVEGCQNNVRKSWKSSTTSALNNSKNILEKHDISSEMAHSRFQSAAAPCTNEEVRFSLTVHSIFLHESVRLREKCGCIEDEELVQTNSNICQLQRTCLQTEESAARLIGYLPRTLIKSANAHPFPGPEITINAYNRPRCQYSWPPRLISKQDANTQTVSSKLLRGFIRRLHEGPRPPRIPQFCVCESDVPGPDSSSLEEKPRSAEPPINGCARVSPSSEAKQFLIPTHNEKIPIQPDALEYASSSFAEPGGTLAGVPLVKTMSLRAAERSTDASGSAHEARKNDYYYAPPYPILKLLLDETPIALGDFTTILHYNRASREAAGVPTVFTGINFMRWPPRLLAETVWVILLQHTRACMRKEARRSEPQQQGLHSGPFNTNSELGVSIKPPGNRGLVDGAVFPANTGAAGAVLQGAAAGNLNGTGVSESHADLKNGAKTYDSPHLSPTSPRHEENIMEILHGTSAHSLAAFTCEYFLGRLDVAVLAHSVLRSFLLSILYWAPVLEAVSQQPQEPGGATNLHRPLPVSGSTWAETRIRTASDDSAFSVNDYAAGEEVSAQTVGEQEVKVVTSRLRGFIPWFAVRLFARITDLLSSPRDTQLLRSSLDDFVRLALQATLEELTVTLPPREKSSRNSFKASTAEKLNRGSVPCDAAMSTLPGGTTMPRARRSAVAHFFRSYGRLSLLHNSPAHFQVPTELCLAVTHRAAARIGMRIFSEEGTSEYRTAVVRAIHDSKEAAVASIMLSEGLSRWAQPDATASSRVGQEKTLRRLSYRGRTSIVHNASTRQHVPRKKGRCDFLLCGKGDGELITCGPPGKDFSSPCVDFEERKDATWELPMPVDLLLQILTQQWEVLYVHLQQAMELVLDETDANLLAPLTSLSAFASFIRRSNSGATSTPEEILPLYRKTLSATSSRLQPFCCPLTSNALSAFLLYQSRLIGLPLPFPPSPFLRLGPLVDVSDTPAVPRSLGAYPPIQTNTRAPPLKSVYTSFPLSFTTSTFTTASQLPSNCFDAATLASPGSFTVPLISSASYEFRIAEFIVSGLLAFVQSRGAMCVRSLTEQGTPCARDTTVASIAGKASAWEGKLFGEGTGSSVQQGEGTKQSVYAKRVSLQSASTTANAQDGPLLTRMREEFSADLHALSLLRQDAQKRPLVRAGEDTRGQAGGEGYCSRRNNIFQSDCCEQRARADGVHTEVEGRSSLCRPTSPRAVATPLRSSQGSHVDSVQLIWPTTGKSSLSTSAHRIQHHSSSKATIGAHPFYSQQEAHPYMLHNDTQVSSCTRLPSEGLLASFLDIGLDRSIALKTAKDIETSAATNGVPAGPLLARLQLFLKALLQVFGETDLPDILAEELSTGQDKSPAALPNRVELVRSLEGFRPLRGRLSASMHDDGADMQMLSSADVGTAQSILRCIWNAIFKISVLLAEEREERRTLEHLIALQRVQCHAAGKEALHELARIYRDQVDRLLILSVGSEGVSALIEQPEVREQLRQMHQSVFDLEQQQLRLQQLFTSAEGAAAAGKLKHPNEQCKEDQVTKDLDVAANAAREEVQQAGSAALALRRRFQVDIAGMQHHIEVEYLQELRRNSI